MIKYFDVRIECHIRVFISACAKVGDLGGCFRRLSEYVSLCNDCVDPFFARESAAAFLQAEISRQNDSADCGLRKSEFFK